MSSLLHRSARPVLAAGLALLLSLTLAGPGSSTQPELAREAPGPIHAGNTFGWYGSNGLVYDKTFVGPLNRQEWKVRGPGLVKNQNGMLTLNTARKGTVSATLAGKGARYGRWEIRLRQRQYAGRGASYNVMTELVPTTPRGQACGARNIALNNFRLGTDKAKFYIRTLPDTVFQGQRRRNLGQDAWHVFAVELTPKRISWFVDSQVIVSERRKEAFSRIPYTVRFTMQAEEGKRMRPARMQMDWLRHWSLKAKNERSTKAPLAKKTSYFPQPC